ncbi:helix-turn-helix domain-containing protein [Enterococcus sp. DIV0802b]|uniref:helix-turn-helix domain-containing protein n=1 Tax=Enterococcus sp. DIV0802b TaxID=2774704 RepID=UPI003D2FC4A8
MNVTYSGFQMHNAVSDHIYRPSGLKHYLFVLTLSPMVFTFEDGHQETSEKGSCILFPPTVYQDYRGKEDFFNSFVEFQTDQVIEKTYAIPCNQLFQPKNIQQINKLIQKINHESLLPQRHTQELIAAYMTNLLVLLERNFEESIPQPQNEHYQLFQAMRLKMLVNCEQQWDFYQFSRELSIGKSQFYKLYQQFFHTTPKEDLLQARFQKFFYLRSNETLTIREAAFQSGFQNINHFNRLFAKRYGCAPTKYQQEQ